MTSGLPGRPGKLWSSDRPACCHSAMRGNVRGVLTVGRAAGSMPLPRAATQLAMTFAAQAGIALELAERREDAERLLVFEDRDRIARDLHDQVIQRLYASGMKLQGTIPLITRPLVEERVNGVVDDLDKTITDIRAAIFSLQARGTDVPGLRSKVARCGRPDDRGARHEFLSPAG